MAHSPTHANTQSGVLLWVDLEMTGLDPASDVIVELAAITTDWDLNELGTYESGIKHDLDELNKIMDSSDWFASQPQQYRQDITAMTQAGLDLADVEGAVLAMLPAGDSDEVYLCGNSIHCDRKFIDKYMPRLAGRLHYRMLDVSSFKLWLATSGRVETFKKGETHRALADIRESIAELRYYSSRI